MLLGWTPGCIGEVSALLLAAGFVYLLIRKVITMEGAGRLYRRCARLRLPRGAEHPAVQLRCVGSPFRRSFPRRDIHGDRLFDLAYDRARTRDLRPRVRTYYTIFIRRFGGYPEGVARSILIMNLLVWYLDRYAKPVRFGGADSAKKKTKTMTRPQRASTRNLSSRRR